MDAEEELNPCYGCAHDLDDCISDVLYCLDCIRAYNKNFVIDYKFKDKYETRKINFRNGGMKMSKFDELKYAGKCDVCGKETDVVVCASSMGAVSWSYCKNCLQDGLEPYNAIVSYIACAGRFPEEINEKYQQEVRRMLNKLGKTEKEFIADVDKSIEKEMEYWKKMSEDTKIPHDEDF